ncbi:hypothetical protein Bbelb_427460 [Branchiostoma belcheri]|nr:hypothetical protein Bbelb_427460 [Branchiostoma belcheri]
METSSQPDRLVDPQTMDDDSLSQDSIDLTDRVATLEQRVQLQEDEIQLLKSALADVLRRLGQYEEKDRKTNKQHAMEKFLYLTSNSNECLAPIISVSGITDKYRGKQTLAGAMIPRLEGGGRGGDTESDMDPSVTDWRDPLINTEQVIDFAQAAEETTDNTGPYLTVMLHARPPVLPSRPTISNGGTNTPKKADHSISGRQQTPPTPTSYTHGISQRSPMPSPKTPHREIKRWSSGDMSSGQPRTRHDSAGSEHSTDSSAPRKPKASSGKPPLPPKNISKRY